MKIFLVELCHFSATVSTSLYHTVVQLTLSIPFIIPIYCASLFHWRWLLWIAMAKGRIYSSVRQDCFCRQWIHLHIKFCTFLPCELNTEWTITRSKNEPLKLVNLGRIITVQVPIQKTMHWSVSWSEN